MKRASAIRVSIVVSTVLAAALALALRQQARIATLREDRRQLTRQLASTAPDPRDGAGSPNPHQRERVDHAAEARRAVAELARLAADENPANVDLLDRADLADRIKAMNAAGIREAVAWLQQADDVDPGVRRKLLSHFLTRLARDHPAEVIALVTELEASPPAWLADHPLGTLLNTAAVHWAAIDPQTAWDWTRERMPDLDERSARDLRSAVIQAIARKYPEEGLRLATEAGIDGSRFLVWHDQTTDEKLASFGAMRDWCGSDASRTATLPDFIRKLTLEKSWGRAVTFAEATEWIERAGLPPEDIRFLTDRSKLDLSYYIDPVETGKWIDWFCHTFPEDWIRRRLDGLLEDHRTRDAARQWLSTQPEDRARNIRGELTPNR